MKTLVDHLSQYAAYHRDQRNIITHFIGIPLIVIAVVVLLSRPGTVMAGLWLSPALVASALAALFYLRLDLRLGTIMTLLLIACLWAGALCAHASTGVWLGIGIAAFVVGWAIQFIGHYYEGRKPAFVDDLLGLIIGPLFVVAEFGFLLGLRNELRQQIEERAGPVRSSETGAVT